MALGYAGWGAGQLERELQDNAWLSGPVDHSVIFDTPYHQRWEKAARLLGVPTRRVLLRHIAPNLLGIVLVYLTLTIPQAILVESFLSFLGLGVQDGVSWGLMLAESTQDVLAGHFGNFLAASLLLFLVLLGLNLLADALQDAFDLREPAR